MEGIQIRHPFPDKRDSLSGQEIIELQDENGLSIWFSRYFFKDVCMLRQCRMIRLWLFWDGAGNYLGMHLFDDEPLTKSDHTLFTEEDYKKLDRILRDTQSILKDLTPEDLEIEIESDDPNLPDAISSATLPALQEVMVKDAVYTCHTLWHTVYGPTANHIQELLMNRTSKSYLEQLFLHDNPLYTTLAVKLTAKNPEYHEAFYPLVANAIKSADPYLSGQALAYFQPEMVKNTSVQRLLVGVIPDVPPHTRNDIIWKLVDIIETDLEALADLFDLFENGKIGTGSLNLLLQLVEAEHLKDERITTALQRLASNENAYIRNLTTNLLNRFN